MHMLVIVAPDYLEYDLLEILRRHDVHAYTQIRKLEGAGETGKAPALPSFFFWSGCNIMIFAVLPSDRAGSVGEALKIFHANTLRASHGMPPPFRVFSLPCEQIL